MLYQLNYIHHVRDCKGTKKNFFCKGAGEKTGKNQKKPEETGKNGVNPVNSAKNHFAADGVYVPFRSYSVTGPSLASTYQVHWRRTGIGKTGSFPMV